ncbi:LPXTG cell wall anchor domain-containing protein [Leifsonia sp. YAF41]|uniref:LPXTG cell wall anchor domain-containing protein n=1 Tax=Leifsonia sp. YAF41 TaxID=3233086 RepID=UPI003F9A667A
MIGSRIINKVAAVALAAGVTSALAVAGVAAPASAASDQILVSADGVSWSTSLNADLFAGAGLLIPEGSQSASLWVKNPTDRPVEVRLSARNVSFSSPDFSANLSLASWNSVDDETLTTQGDAVTKCEILVNSQSLAAGGVLKAIVTLTMADVFDLVAQDADANVNVMVSMRDAAAGAFPASACDDDGVIVGPTTPTAPTPGPTTAPSTPTGTITGSGAVTTKPLAQTGADAATPALVVAGLLGGGLVFFLIGRRRRKTDAS